MIKLSAVILSAVLALSGLVMPSSVQAAPEFVLSLNLPLPPIHMRWAGPLKKWCDEVEKRTNGRVKVEPYFAEALSPRSEAFESIRTGIADLTECAYEANSGQFPFHEGILSISSPNVYLENGCALIDGMYKKFPQVLKELEGVHVLFSHASTSLIIGTTNKPVRTLEDLKGMKIQANSAMIAERLKKLGVSVVSIPLSDLYTALEQGVVEGTTCSPELIVSRRWADNIKYMTALSTQNTLFYVAMNENVYDNFPDDIKKVIDDVSAEIGGKDMPRYWVDSDLVAMKKWLSEMAGKEFILLSEADYAKAAEIMQPPVDDWFEMIAKKHGLPGKEMKQTFYELEKQLGAPWAEANFYKEYKAFMAGKK